MRQWETKKTKDSDAVSKEEHKHNDAVASLDYAHVYKSILLQAKKLPSISYPAAKHLKHSKLSISHT